MALTFGLNSVRDLFAKLQRDAYLLEEEVTTDRFFNFVVTGYSMVHWIRNDPSVPQAAKTQYGNLHKDYWLSICGDIANACKHFTLTSIKSDAKSATSTQGYGLGRYSKGNYNEGEESIGINCPLLPPLPTKPLWGFSWHKTIGARTPKKYALPTAVTQCSFRQDIP